MTKTKHMDKTLTEPFKDIPEIINSQYEMEQPNLAINIHQGEFTVIQEDKTVTVIGKIFFDWVPHQNVKFE